jgi:hypothetical protein
LALASLVGFTTYLWSQLLLILLRVDDRLAIIPAVVAGILALGSKTARSGISSDPKPRERWQDRWTIIHQNRHHPGRE